MYFFRDWPKTFFIKSLVLFVVVIILLCFVNENLKKKTESTFICTGGDHQHTYVLSVCTEEGLSVHTY